MIFFYLKSPIFVYRAKSIKKIINLLAESFYDHKIKLHMKKSVRNLIKTKKGLDITQ